MPDADKFDQMIKTAGQAGQRIAKTIQVIMDRYGVRNG